MYENWVKNIGLKISLHIAYYQKRVLLAEIKKSIKKSSIEDTIVKNL